MATVGACDLLKASRVKIRNLLLLTVIAIHLSSCNSETRCTSESPQLFGNPSENTGLSNEQCSPRCDDCEGGFEAMPYSAEFSTWLEERVLLDEPSRLPMNPYDENSVDTEPASDVVCVVTLEPGEVTYSLASQPQTVALDPVREFITHRGRCGLCSSLSDLAVYISNPDLTAPVRACGARGFTDGEQAQFDCLLEIGFSEPCADIWLYNILNTRQKCLAVCLEYLEEPHHLQDGSLNPCIQCDEDESGPVFKRVAGRTRRNSGLASGLCRPCESVYRLHHDYGFIPLNR